MEVSWYTSNKVSQQLSIALVKINAYCINGSCK